MYCNNNARSATLDVLVELTIACSQPQSCAGHGLLILLVQRVALD